MAEGKGEPGGRMDVEGLYTKTTGCQVEVCADIEAESFVSIPEAGEINMIMLREGNARKREENNEENQSNCIFRG